ncbi:MAG: septum formation protein Maf [Ignavibacteria bacterium RBG_16_34_14]|nr:MAG: septum formation protein Maf [Ignavibacteria bacterium RBG_16_34_14]
MKTNYPIWLASTSPRRKKLLRQLNISFKTFKVKVDEKIKKGESPVKTVKRLSLEKMRKAKREKKKGIIITADTIVVLNKKIIGKPVNETDAVNILNRLSGKTHIVYTGFCIANLEKKITINDYEKTSVTFRELNNKEILDYVKSGSPIDKAGAYGIQDDFGAVFIKKINGCYYNVVGLPLQKVYKALLEVV